MLSAFFIARRQNYRKDFRIGMRERFFLDLRKAFDIIRPTTLGGG
jgi:hypothetical protein